MLDAFILSNRDIIVTRTESRCHSRQSPAPGVELANGLPAFLNQLGATLCHAQSSGLVDHEVLGKTAAQYGYDLSRVGLTVGAVVHVFGDVGQTIMQLAIEQDVTFSSAELKTLSLCLDHAIAEAVTEFGRQREHTMADAGRSLEIISVGGLVEEIENGALLQAGSLGLNLTLTSVDRSIAVEGDRKLLRSTVSHLLQNAFRFTPRRGNVSLTVDATADRVFIAIEDECGGREPGHMGAGSGLSICIDAAKANGGELRIRDLPGRGCVFTLDLPRKVSLAKPVAPDMAARIALTRRKSSVALPRRVAMQEAADSARRALREFVAMEPDEPSLADWLSGPYREATCFVPRRARGQRPQPPPGVTPLTTTRDLITVARGTVIAALDAAHRGNEDLLGLLPPIVHVEPAHDAGGNHGFVPIDGANMRLVDRVLALLLADYLTRPDDYRRNRHRGLNPAPSIPAKQTA